MALIVDGERIEDSQIQEEIARLRPRYEKVFADKAPEEREAELLAWSQENLIECVLFQQELKKDKTPVSPEIIDRVFAKLRDEYETPEAMQKAFGTDEQGIRSMIEQHTKERLKIRDIGNTAPAPSNARILEYYEQNKERFKAGEQIRVAHIVKQLDGSSDEPAAMELMTRAGAEILSGASFEAVSQKYADSVDAIRDLGFISRGEMPEEFDDIAFNLGAGQTSRVFRTRFGFHIAKVYERRSARVPALQEVKQQIVDALSLEIREEAFASHLDDLRRKAKIEHV